jgi:hypothetical protein
MTANSVLSRQTSSLDGRCTHVFELVHLGLAGKGEVMCSRELSRSISRYSTLRSINIEANIRLPGKVSYDPTSFCVFVTAAIAALNI